MGGVYCAFLRFAYPLVRFIVHVVRQKTKRCRFSLLKKQFLSISDVLFFFSFITVVSLFGFLLSPLRQSASVL